MLRSAFGLASENVRASAAWQFSRLFHVHDAGQSNTAKNNKEPDENYSVSGLWKKLGKSFFIEVWPLEPGLQSAASANDFARIPVGVGEAFFADAVQTILPYLQPFDAWALVTEFQLDPNKSSSERLVRSFPHEMLVLLAVCIAPNQSHEVHGLKVVLDWITEARPELKQDYRMRALRRLGV